MPGQQHATASLHLRRLGWLLALWALGVLSLAAVALLLRIVMSLAGLTA